MNAGQPGLVGSAPDAPADTARPAGDTSPWFKPPRVARPPMPQVSVRQSRPPVAQQTRSQAPAAEGVFDPRVAPPMPVPTAPAKQREPVKADRFEPEAGFEREFEPEFEAEFPEPDLQSADAERPELTLELGIEALVSYIDTFGHQPDEQRLARYLLTNYGVTGARPGTPVAMADMKRIWPELADGYASLGRE